jgi:anti-sigma regulatory factor (Ser/Thr protein kinase)
MSAPTPIRLDLPADLTALQAARRALAAMQPNDNARLVVGELVTNAVLHGAPPIRLSAIPLGTRLFIEVSDGRRDLGPAAHDSRGLRVVEALTVDWGVDVRLDGKMIWAALLR